MAKKETLEELVEFLKKAPSTHRYDAILAYDRFRANTLLLQEYIDRFDSDQYFEPVTFSTVITPGVRWEKSIDFLLDKPRLSFENSSLSSSRADLTMRITGGNQLTLDKASGAAVKKVSGVKMGDALDGPALHMRIELDSTSGSVTQAGTVYIDLKKASAFYLSFADTDEENMIGGERYKRIFDSWPDEKKIYVLNKLQMMETDFLQPEKFVVRTDAAPSGKVRGSDQYGEGAVLLFVTMKGSDNGDAGIPEEMHYLLPNAVVDYTMNFLLGNKFLIARMVTRGLEKFPALVGPFEVKYTTDGVSTHITGIQATAGKVVVPVAGSTANLVSIEFPQGLTLSLVGDEADDFTRFEVKAVNEKLRFEWYGKQASPVTINTKTERVASGRAVCRWEYTIDYEFVVETSGDEIGKLSLKPFGTPTLRQRVSPDADLNTLWGDEMEEFVNFCEDKIDRYLATTIGIIATVAEEIDAFRLNGLLFRGGKEAVQPSTVRFPGDLTLPGFLAPARTQFEVQPSEAVVVAGGKQEFVTTAGSDLPMKWTVENLPGEEDDNPGSIDEATGVYTAPPSSEVLRSNKRVIVTATSGSSYSKALLSVNLRSIAVAPLVRAVNTGATIKLSAAALGREPVTFTLLPGAKGSLTPDPAPDPEVQQGMLYIAPPAASSYEANPCKSEAWRRLRATAAWRIEDDLAEVLAIDTVEVTTESGGKEQIPILLPLKPETHWFIHEAEGDGVRLKFWGENKSGQYEVPADLTTWYLVSGNGTLKDGLYTPVATDGKPLSNYAVIVAVETNNHFWLWSFVILPFPLVTPEVLIEKLTEPDDPAFNEGGEL
ncbi:hypothetical protein OO258_22640 [Pseudomonas sp. DCB_BI]|uniref:hypothetical protein n=1 Tax=Pseudomonas sp. DCB_BI TaxID=2993594 RepID=UPI00224AB85A|nr:hypothetical protein [Pseudomonas sp. DCB_BI]MCX2891035.1 hypothetical protein [Pseudomonas sp. DCB_BI]